MIRPRRENAPKDSESLVALLMEQRTMQRKDAQVALDRDCLAPQQEVARPHFCERSSHSSVADLRSIVSAAHERVEEASLREEALRPSEAKFRTLADSIACAIFISRGRRLHYVNHAAEVITGYTREELLALNFWDLVHPATRETVINQGNAPREKVGLTLRSEVGILTKNHEERWLDITATPIDFDGEPSILISAFDLTERKRMEEQAQLLAITDPLTGLGNYRRLLDVLHAEIERSGRTRRPFAILLLDLDGLKEINDSYGHVVGSRALCRLGDALRLFCRAVDTATRYGGDEFAVVLPETTAGAAGFVVSRIRERMAADSEQPALSASIGVAVYPQDGETIEALLQTADRELYGMKNRSAEQPFFARG